MSKMQLRIHYLLKVLEVTKMLKTIIMIRYLMGTTFDNNFTVKLVLCIKLGRKSL